MANKIETAAARSVSTYLANAHVNVANKTETGQVSCPVSSKVDQSHYTWTISNICLTTGGPSG